MPQFNKPNQSNSNNNSNAVAPITPSNLSYRDVRCKVCSSDFAKAIDRMIALGTSHSEIARIFDISRSSIGRHAKNHLNYEEAAVRQIIAREMEEAQADIEEGISGAISRRAYIDVAIQKGFEALLDNNVTVEVKDVATLIQLKEKMDSETDGAALDEVRTQFNAFVQAIREVAPPEMWEKILIRTRELVQTPGLPSPSQDQ
jgi:transcriptional regulator of heat shock response